MSVKVFLVMAPPQPDGPDPEWEAERMVFIKDGFSVPALIVPVLWLFWHRMWLPLLAYVGYMVVISAVELGFGNLVSGIIAAGCTLLFALEANNLRRWSLGAKGWRLVGEAVGRNRNEAEFLFFRDWAGKLSRPIQRPPAAKPAANPPARPAPDRPGDDEPSVFGLFPEPER